MPNNDKFICDIISLIASDKQHVVRIRSTSDNPFMTEEELRQTISHPSTRILLSCADIYVQNDNDIDSSVSSIVLGFREVIIDRIRQCCLAKRLPLQDLVYFNDVTTYTIGASGFERADD